MLKAFWVDDPSITTCAPGGAPPPPHFSRTCQGSHPAINTTRCKCSPLRRHNLPSAVHSMHSGSSRVILLAFLLWNSSPPQCWDQFGYQVDLAAHIKKPRACVIKLPVFPSPVYSSTSMHLTPAGWQLHLRCVLYASSGGGAGEIAGSAALYMRTLQSEVAPAVTGRYMSSACVTVF